VAVKLERVWVLRLGEKRRPCVVETTNCLPPVRRPVSRIIISWLRGFIEDRR
jgi:hypothetical protein